MAEVKKTNAKKTSTNNKDTKIKELEETIANLNSIVTNLLAKQAATQPIIDGDRDIVFISLCNNVLNLSTEGNGMGEIYTFYEFGEEQSIPYADAKKIIKNNKKFIKGGKCYIADDDIIKSEHLEQDYKKILSKDELMELLQSDKKKFHTIFDAMTNSQKELFADIVSDQLIKDKNNVDMNIVQYINESLKIDILDNVKYSSELFKDIN